MTAEGRPCEGEDPAGVPLATQHAWSSLLAPNFLCDGRVAVNGGPWGTERLPLKNLRRASNNTTISPFLHQDTFNGHPKVSFYGSVALYLWLWSNKRQFFINIEKKKERKRVSGGGGGVSEGAVGLLEPTWLVSGTATCSPGFLSLRISYEFEKILSIYQIFPNFLRWFISTLI